MQVASQRYKEPHQSHLRDINSHFNALTPLTEQSLFLRDGFAENTVDLGGLTASQEFPLTEFLTAFQRNLFLKGDDLIKSCTQVHLQARS